MKKLIIYVFILGIGIGFIGSSMMNLVNNKMYTFRHEVYERLAAGNGEREEKDPTDAGKEQKKKSDETDEKLEEQGPVQINIEADASSEEIAELLYQNKLINNKDDFKILLNLKTLDTMKTGQVLTDKGIVSRGWKITQLLGVIARKQDLVIAKMYEANLIDDRTSLEFIVGILKEHRRVVPGQKSIRRGSSIHEIIQEITQ